MWFQPGILRRRLVLAPPDVREARGDRHLLVWGDLPHWMVVDGDLRGVLDRLDGKLPLRRLAEDVGQSPRKLARIAGRLVKLGVLRDPQAPAPVSGDPPEAKIENIAVN